MLMLLKRPGVCHLGEGHRSTPSIEGQGCATVLAAGLGFGDHVVHGGLWPLAAGYLGTPDAGCRRLLPGALR